MEFKQGEMYVGVVLGVSNAGYPLAVHVTGVYYSAIGLAGGVGGGGSVILGVVTHENKAKLKFIELRRR